jgi:signal peptidase II
VIIWVRPLCARFYLIWVMMKSKYGILIMTLLTALDQVSKAWVVRTIPLNDQIPVFSNFINLTHIKNPGVSLGFLSNLPDAVRTPLLVGVSTIVSFGMIYYLLRNWQTIEGFAKAGLIFIIPGAFGNLIDRVFFGTVTDFIQFKWYNTGFFSNNLADCFISVGVVIFLIGLWFGSRRKPEAMPIDEVVES